MFEDINDGITNYNISEIKKEQTVEVKTKDGGIPFSVAEINISDEELVYLRLDSLKIAKDISITIYNNQKDTIIQKDLSNELSENSNDLLATIFKDLDIFHKIADYNLKYILGGN